MGRRFAHLLVLTILLFTVTPPFVHAATLGISPPIFEAEAVKGDVLEGEVYIMRTNPNTNEYVNVSVSDDPTGAVVLLGDTRLLLPVGESTTAYRFNVLTQHMDSNTLQAKITFTNDIPSIDLGTQRFLTAVAMPIQIELVETMNAQEPTQVDSPSEAQILSESLASLMSLDKVLTAAALVLFGLFFLLRLSHAKFVRRGSVFVLVLSIGALMIGIGRLTIDPAEFPIRRFETSPKGMLIRDGNFFIQRTPEADYFVNPIADTSEMIGGAWNFFVTSQGRFWMVSADQDTSSDLHNTLYRFQDSSLRAYPNPDNTFLITEVKENSPGTYALFTGTDEQGAPTWCVSEVFNTSTIACDFLEDRVSEEVIQVSFTQEDHLLIIQTATQTYQYDVWRQTLSTDQDVREIVSASFPASNIFAQEATRSVLGFVRLDEELFWVGFNKAYYPISERIWMEKSPMDDAHRTPVFALVHTEGARRSVLTSLQFDAPLFWLRKSGVLNSP